MVSLTLLVTTVISIAAVVNGFEIQAQKDNTIVGGAKVFIEDDGLLILKHDFNSKPADFEFKKDELVLTGTKKVVHVLENGQCRLFEKGKGPAKSKTKTFKLQDGRIRFNKDISYKSALATGTRGIFFLSEKSPKSNERLMTVPLAPY